MNSAKLAIKRPIFITCIVLAIIILGGISYFNLGLELFPDMTFPTISVSTSYPGAAPEEIEKQITKPIEDQLGALNGVKHLNSTNTEGQSIITIEFSTSVDIDKAAQEVRDKVSLAKNSLPDDLEDDPIVQKFDPDAEAVIRLAIISDLPDGKLYDVAKEKIKPKLERVDNVGNVDIIGGTKREIQIEFDRRKLNDYKTSITSIASQIQRSGSNVPVGKKENGGSQTVFRSIGEFSELRQIENTLVSFSGDFGRSTAVKDLGTVRDMTEDKDSLAYIYYPAKGKDGKRIAHDGTKTRACIFLDVIKQSGTNTVKVVDGVKKQLPAINAMVGEMGGNTKVIVTSDQSTWIRTNVEEAVTSIVVGILLAVIVVYFFLGNVRSTLITAVAIPNSLLGAIVVMNIMGYTFNLMTLMAISLAVGLLVDDAIVVRENIFRKLEKGMTPHKAAEVGTTEVTLAVIATTLTIIAVFLPVGMIGGIIGKIFKPFAFTVVFAMAVSLFDALTVAPFLSAYFAGKGTKTVNPVIRSFEKFQSAIDRLYEKVMKYALNHPLAIIGMTMVVFLSSIALMHFVKMTFSPSGDRGEFGISVELPAGTSLQGTRATLDKIEQKLKTFNEVNYYTVSIGSDGLSNKGSISCTLVNKRKRTSQEYMEEMRIFLKDYAYANPSVSDSGRGGGGDSKPFSLIVSGYDLPSVEKGAGMIAEAISGAHDLTDVDSGLKKGNPEYRVVFDQSKMRDLGVSDTTAGTELRYTINGVVVGKFREAGLDYDIRARLAPEQRDLQARYREVKVPNVNGQMVSLSSVAEGKMTTGSAEIKRRDKAYIIEVSANMAPDGAIGNAMTQAAESISKKVKLPEGVSFSFSGEAENFSETGSSIVFALILAIVFIYMVLASLYESFVTPMTILLAIPPALTGALLALFVTGEMLNMMSMIGMVMLIGLVTKNSILLVDFALEGVRSGLDRKEAILQAGRKRLRPILMTTCAMLAGTLPTALGIGEAAKMRQSMGIAIMGGLIISTVITLVVVPAVFEYIDKFRAATESRIIVREDDSVSDREVKKKRGK